MRINNEQVWSVKKTEQNKIFHEDNTIFMKFPFGNIPFSSLNLTLTGIFVAHYLWTHCPLWITMCGQTLPIVLTKVKKY